MTCDVVDLRYSSDARLRRYRTLVIPPLVHKPLPAISARIARLAAARVAIAAHVPLQRGSGITVLAGTDATFGIAVNWTNAPRRFGGSTWTGIGTFDVPPFIVAPRDARIVVIAGAAPPVPTLPALPKSERPSTTGYDLNAKQAVHVDLPAVAPREAVVSTGAAFGSGAKTITIANALVFAVIVPDGGARLVLFGRRGQPGYNATNATGALRDDVLVQPPPSKTDRIAKYTHSYPAGTYNRTYRTEIVSSGGAQAVVRFRYDAPDLGGGAHFEKTVRLVAGSARLIVDERVTFDGKDSAQRAVSLSAVAALPGDAVELGQNFTASDRRHTLAITWDPAAAERATWTRYGSNGTVTLVAAAKSLRTTYSLSQTADAASVRAFAQSERDWLAANPNPP